MKKKRVVVAMSGGVESSLTAALLQQEGYDVVGITMQIWPSSLPGQQAEGGCCSLVAVDDARRVADKLGIPYYVVNFQDPFEDQVIKYFCAEYSRGRTPNPCIKCNEIIKFGFLLKKTLELEGDFLATGHYAQKDHNGSRYLLRKAVDLKKDQTYNLYSITQEQLKYLLFPLGKFRKTETREMARELGLAVADKPDSQEICFIPDNNYKRFLQEYSPEVAKPGKIVDRSGKVLGRHEGVCFYTIGQRKGLGLSAGKPLYVIDLDPETNTVIVGENQEIFTQGLIAEQLNWVAISSLEEPLEVQARIRYSAPDSPALITPLSNGEVKVEFQEPQRAITPGQAVVFYQGDILVGGGIIQKSY